MAKAKRMGETELKALVAREISLAKDSRAERSKKHEKALNYYQGDMAKYITSETGRSSAVSRDLADTVGWMLPGIMKVFTASEHMAVAEPVGKEDMDFANDATDDINHVFWKENDGYRIVYDATWDSLVVKNGIVKTWFDETPEYRVSFHTGLTEDEYTALVEPEDGAEIEVLAKTERPQMVADPQTGEPVEISICDVKIRRLIRKGKTRCIAIPPEDFGIDSEAVVTSEARFVYHRDEKTRSDLIEMGFDRKLVMSLGQAPEDDTNEKTARGSYDTTEDGDPSMEVVDYYECYVRVDIDGDGIAEMVRVDYAGNSSGGEILDWNEWEDDHPFDDIPCNPMPHTWEATSIADETMDVQEIKTVLLRQGLDNTYATNNPQRFVKGKILNPDELFSPSFGGAIFGDANSEVTNLSVEFVADHAYEAIRYQDEVIERRTGVSRSTMALDPDTLQNQTAEAVRTGRDAAYSQIELVARNQAELGWKKVFRKILKLEIKHQDKPRDIRMRGEFRTVDPRHWNADMDISINVGLGTGSRDRDMAMLQMVLANQTALIDRLQNGGFPDKALEMVPYVLTTLNKSAEAAGIRSPELFYPTVTGDEIEAGKKRIAEMAQQPDPKIEAEKVKAELDAQAKNAQGQRDHEYRMAQVDAKLTLDQVVAEYQHNQRVIQINGEMDLKRRQLIDELGLKQELGHAELAVDLELGHEANEVKDRTATSGVHMGGDPG